MSAQHTQGRLTLDNETDITGVENDPENGCVGPVDVVHVHLRTVPGRTEANARRLVACWNACQNIETEMLEKFTLGVISAEHSRVTIERTRQRDELLAALNLLKAWDFGAAVVTAEDEKRMDGVAAFARAAIAKAGGGA